MFVVTIDGVNNGRQVVIPSGGNLGRLRSDALRAHLTLHNIETYALIRDAADTRADTRA